MLLVASETGHVYTFATRKLQPMITSESGKALIQTCLNSPDPSPASSVQQMQQSEGTLSQESSPPTQVGIPVANVSRATLSQNNIEGGELHYQTEDNDVKVCFCFSYILLHVFLIVMIHGRKCLIASQNKYHFL